MEENTIQYQEIKSAITILTNQYSNLIYAFNTNIQNLDSDYLIEKRNKLTYLSQEFFEIFSQTAQLEFVISGLIAFIPKISETLRDTFQKDQYGSNFRKQYAEFIHQSKNTRRIFKQAHSKAYEYEDQYKSDRNLFLITAHSILINSSLGQFHSEINSLAHNPDLLKNSKELIEHYRTTRDELETNCQKAQKLVQDTDTLYKQNQQISREVKTLKADAIQLGLTQRYTKEKNKNRWAKWIWNFLIIISLGLLATFSNIPSEVYQNTKSPTKDQIQQSNFSQAFLHILSVSPAYLALIWFILFASRRRNEANRLASDYAHKEVFASSYEAYQEEIKKLKEMYKDDAKKTDELTELNIKLLDSMIGVLSDNPAKSLDVKKSTDELPAKELINLASEIIKFKGNKQ